MHARRCAKTNTSMQFRPAAQRILHTTPRWLRAIDDALITSHVGVADPTDSYEAARAKLEALIGFHVGVATDPAVNGGWKLVPVVSTPEMDDAGSVHCDGYLSVAQSVLDSMLTTAPKPEAKP